MLICGTFGILVFIASIILAVQNKGNRDDHGQWGRYQGRNPFHSYYGSSYCSTWNCDTIIAGNVGYPCFSLRHHAFVNQTSASKRNISILIIVKNFVLRVKMLLFFMCLKSGKF